MGAYLQVFAFMVVLRCKRSGKWQINAKEDIIKMTETFKNHVV